MTTEAETPLEWTGVINFKLEREDDPGNLQEYDLCQLIGKQSKDDVKTKLYFDLENYQPPEGTKKDLVRCGSYKRLAQELRQAAFKSGSTIFVNSTGVARKDARTTWKFTCSACRKAKEGQRFKRCTTSKPLPGQKTCKFTFTVAADQRGFYLIQTAGNPNHNGHNRIDVNNTNGTLPNRLSSQGKSNDVAMDGGLGSEMFAPDAAAVASDSIKEQVKREVYETLSVLETAEREMPADARALTVEFCASLATFREGVKAKQLEVNERKRSADDNSPIVGEKRACV